MKYAILSVAMTLMLGGCSASQNAVSGYDSGTGQGVSAFPVNLHGGQPYMARPAKTQMQQCSVTATAFEPPAAEDPNRFNPPADGAPMKLIAASCWI